MDFYEGLSGTDFANDIEGGQFGLTWLASFAAQNKVKIALSEVATGTSSSPAEGNGCPRSNDGAFMQQLVDWVNALPAGAFTHFVFSPRTPADDLISSGNSAIQDVWKQSWGGTHFGGTWWKGPKVPTHLRWQGSPSEGPLLGGRPLVRRLVLRRHAQRDVADGHTVGRDDRERVERRRPRHGARRRLDDRERDALRRPIHHAGDPAGDQRGRRRDER